MAFRERFQDVEFLRQHVAHARRFIEETAGYSFQELVEHKVFHECDDIDWNLNLESPLEAAFWVWWEAMIVRARWPGDYLRLQEQVSVSVGDEQFRLDFSVELDPQLRTRAVSAGAAWKPIAIELDGHAFHEKTREQATYRNRRDRLLQQAGWKVFHISFDEMQCSGEAAVGEVATFTKQQFSDFYIQVCRYERDARALETHGA